MNGERVYIQGELYLTLETFAETYQIRAVWLREVYEQGLLGEGVRRGDTICIAAFQLERMATIIQLHDLLGLSLDSIQGVLEQDAEAVGE